MLVISPMGGMCLSPCYWIRWNCWYFEKILYETWLWRNASKHTEIVNVFMRQVARVRDENTWGVTISFCLHGAWRIMCHQEVWITVTLWRLAQITRDASWMWNGGPKESKGAHQVVRTWLHIPILNSIQSQRVLQQQSGIRLPRHRLHWKSTCI